MHTEEKQKIEAETEKRKLKRGESESIEKTFCLASMAITVNNTCIVHREKKQGQTVEQ